MYHKFHWTKVAQRRNWILKEYEPIQPFYLLELATAVGAKCFLDVGANIGFYSVIMSQQVSLVLTYEANSMLLNEIKKNFDLNSVSSVIRPVAVSNKSGTVSFGVVSRYAGDSGVISTQHGNKKYSSTVSVDSVRLDDELKEIDGPIVLKVDVEGHELAVLQGAKSILMNKSCIIQIENYNDVVNNFLLDLGYLKLTDIGPDSYFTNIRDIDPLQCYEKAIKNLIQSNHDNKSMVFGRGGLRFIVSGKLYQVIRWLASKLYGRRL